MFFRRNKEFRYTPADPRDQELMAMAAWMMAFVASVNQALGSADVPDIAAGVAELHKSTIRYGADVALGKPIPKEEMDCIEALLNAMRDEFLQRINSG